PRHEVSQAGLQRLCRVAHELAQFAHDSARGTRAPVDRTGRAKLAVHRLHDELDAVGFSNFGAECTGMLARLWSIAYRKGFGEGRAVEGVDGNWLRPRTGACHDPAPEELIAE